MIHNSVPIGPAKPVDRALEPGRDFVAHGANGPERNRRRRTLVSIVVATLLVAAGTGGYVFVSHWLSANPSPRGDGPTLYGALAAVNQSVDETPGGPWTLSQVYGVASPVPTDPSSWGWGPYDEVLASCQSAFNGLTLWNGTIPVFDGTFNSGTAPFWQLVFFSNTSQQLLVTTDVLGVTHVYPPIAMTSRCAEGTGLSNKPWGMSQLFDFSGSGFPGNTPGMAAAAWTDDGKDWTSWIKHVPTEMFLMGAAQFGSGQPPDTMTTFFTCGTPGGAGATPGLDVFAQIPDTSKVGGSFNYTIGCTPTADNFSAIPVQVDFSNTTTAQGASGVAVSAELRLSYPGGPPYGGPAYNAAGITSWMVGLNLTDAEGTKLPVANPLCSTWVPTVADCPANASGWYAVLLSPDNEWEGVYGATDSGSGWSYPVLPIANNETLAVVVPASWNVTGDSLEVSSTTSRLPLTGSVVVE
jgi:hypothetical protein